MHVTFVDILQWISGLNLAAWALAARRQEVKTTNIDNIEHEIT